MHSILRRSTVSAISAVCVFTATTAAAHHGWSDYDADRQTTLEGRVDASSYENPHATIVLVSGGHKYNVVLAPVSRMEARGASRSSVAVGRSVTVVGYPSRSHADEIRAERITVVDGAETRTVELR